MSKGKFVKKRKTNAAKTAVMILAVAMLIGCMIGGTVAWLISESKTVSNTFVAGQIGTLELTETDADKQYLIVPGTPIVKDPVVAYAPTGTNEEAWVEAYVFVEIDAAKWTKNGNTYSMVEGEGDAKKTLMSWTVAEAEGWLPVEGEDNVYYFTTKAAATKPVIAGNKITVNPTAVTEDNIKDLADDSGLNFSVYAIQKDNLSVTEAWAALNS